MAYALIPVILSRPYRECGDIIDCVDMYKQPSLKNPLLRDHKSQIAAAYGVSGPYHGASAWIPIWKTAVEPSEFSKSYLLIASPSVRDFVPIRGKDPPNTDNQVAVGIAVYSKYFGDDFPRLYIYSTNDAGVKLKCFNLECPFVQTSNKFAIGGRFVNFSTVGGTLYGSHIIIYRDAGPSVWWVSLMDEAIGYFREWVPAGRAHTLTPMRSGMFPSDGPRNAAAIAYTGADLVDDPVNSIVTHPKDCGPVLASMSPSVVPGDTTAMPIN
uniref:Hypothetical_protein n=1 Tax=Oryza brachyantha TaxID=4533 RepID=G2XM37_ORYBR|nr:hypothetical_protein [Oryza brachyantha]